MSYKSWEGEWCVRGMTTHTSGLRTPCKPNRFGISDCAPLLHSAASGSTFHQPRVMCMHSEHLVGNWPGQAGGPPLSMDSWSSFAEAPSFVRSWPKLAKIVARFLLFASCQSSSFHTLTFSPLFLSRRHRKICPTEDYSNQPSSFHSHLFAIPV